MVKFVQIFTPKFYNFIFSKKIVILFLENLYHLVLVDFPLYNFTLTPHQYKIITKLIILISILLC